jgi:type VI secretion system protein ImpC
MPDAQAAPAAAAGAVQTTEKDKASLLDQILDATKPIDRTERARNADYIKQFIEKVVQPGSIVSKDLENNIKHWIGELDKKLSEQLNEIMHNPAFQKLEGTWRGIKYLVNQSETGPLLKLRVLNAKKEDLRRDMTRASEFDQSHLFKQVYEEEFGTLGGHPYGMLVGDYEFDRSSEDIGLLQQLSQVAAAAHAPFVAAASPKLFNFESYMDLTKPRDLSMIFESVEYTKWKTFRESEDSRYMALTLPRVLGRLPYGKDFTPTTRFNYEESVDGRDHSKYLWMNSSWAYAARVTDAYAQHGWMAATRGIENGGKVEDLPVHTFPTDDGAVAMKCPTEIAISDRREYELSNLGFLPLLHAKNRDFAVFMGAQSCQKPKVYDDPSATASADLSSKFNLLLCVSRFTHYLKVMARDKIGSFAEVEDCTKWLNRWIRDYVLANPESAGLEMRAKKPLRDARIDVYEVPGRPGHYQAKAYLRPHFQLETLTVGMSLVADVPEKKK